jgi:AraC-like DNA-binding protein
MAVTILTKFSTGRWPYSRHGHVWRDCMSEVYYPLDTQPTNPDSFSGELTWLQLPRIGLSLFSANAMYTIHHGSTRVPEECAFIFPTRQPFRCCQRGIENDVAPGEMVMLGSGVRYWTRIGDSDRNVTIKVPLTTMREMVPSIDEGFGRKNLANPCLIPILTQLAFQTLRVSSSASTSAIHKAEESLLNLLCLTLETRGASQVAQSHHSPLAELSYQRVSTFMTCRFADPDLTPGRIAAALKISTRYVHKLFHRNETTFGKELLTIRLREADRLLRGAAVDGKAYPQIADIAYRCGFSSQSHFSVRYKEHFGCTPREARTALS